MDVGHPFPLGVDWTRAAGTYKADWPVSTRPETPMGGVHELPGFRLTGTMRPLETTKETEVQPIGLWLGRDRSTPLEVAAYSSRGTPSEGLARRVWKNRLGGRATPVLVVIEHPNGEGRAACSLVGPTGEEPIFVEAASFDRARQVCQAALIQPDRHAAIRFLQATLPDLLSRVPGIRNEGFLATHELQDGVPRRPDWATASKKGEPALSKRGRDLVTSLGFQLEEAGRVWFLKAGGKKSAVAVFLDQNEVPEQVLSRFENVSPVSYAINRADLENAPYVILTTPTSIRIYPTKIGVGVGQRGRTETFVEAHLDILTPADAGYLWLLFSADAVKEHGTLEDILEKSTDYRASLGARLRSRVYEDVVPKLATALAKARSIKRPTAAQLEETYQMALLLLFRLLFVAYAEDKDLLPYRSNAQYKRRSLKQKAKELLERWSLPKPDANSTTLWEEVGLVFRAVDQGNAAWGVPAYNGGLFNSEPEDAPIGALLEGVKLADADYAPALASLFIDKDDDGQLGPVDFRSLGVREFGTIYEGLLESELSFAESELAVDAKTGAYRPPKKSENTVVHSGEYYLASTSGTRKATGSYFTKEFAVEHLLDHALEPALTLHIERLRKVDDAKAADAFFDFRVADISMGSGHFLVAAVDHIEKRFTGFLAERPLPGVVEELARLRKAAHDTLGDAAGSVEIEDALLLRRQIARRCIYGVDLKEGAVELARVSLWIHTFVPGLPLSLLDQHLVRGNSLIGIATAAEAERLLKGESKAEVKKGAQVRTHTLLTLFGSHGESLMHKAAGHMREVGKLSDATIAQVKDAKREWEAAVRQARPWVALMDVLAASRLDEGLRTQVATLYEDWTQKPDGILKSPAYQRAQTVLGTLEPFHFPVRFPEAFFRDERPGFDVIVGNPPWEEATVEEDQFWLRINPGLKSMGQGEAELVKEKLRRDRPDLRAKFEQEKDEAEKLRSILTGGDYPGMGTGDPDLYKAFCWRFWHLLAGEGHMGVVLPRTAFCAKGSGEFRSAVFREGIVRDLTFLKNTKEWVFDGVTPQYTVALAAIRRRAPDSSSRVPLRGPFRSHSAFSKGVQEEPVTFPVAEVQSWTDTASLPLLPSDESTQVFAQLRKQRRLDDSRGEWDAVPYREFDATNDKKEKGGVIEFPAHPPNDYWPVFKGESFDLWKPDTGAYYGWANRPAAVARLMEKRVASSRRTESAFAGLSPQVLKDPSTLPCQAPRVAFRDIARATDARTIISALLPGQVLVTNKAPYFVWKKGDAKDQAFLLGVLCSLPLDWYARRFVELGVNFHILNPFPIPRPDRNNPLWKQAVRLAGRLASVDARFKDWAEVVGTECGSLSATEKEDMIHELDAVVAHLYGLSEPQVRHIFETFHEGWDYLGRLEKTLRHYRKWEAKA